MRSSDPRGEDWFTSLYANHYPHIVRYGIRRLPEKEAAAELAQEVFTIAWRRRGRVPDYALPWLYTVARRLLANEWRARRARPAQVPLAGHEPFLIDSGQARPEDAVAVADLWTALATLPDADQEILQLVGWEQLSVSEAAAVLECRPATAAVRLHRARRRLRAALAPTYPSTTLRPATARHS